MCNARPCVEARRRLAESQAKFGGAGLFDENPIILGESNGVKFKIRVAVAYEDFTVNQQFWVEGSLVPQLISDGVFIDITDRLSSGRMWKVGVYTYFSLADAKVAASATGLPVVEVG